MPSHTSPLSRASGGLHCRLLLAVVLAASLSALLAAPSDAARLVQGHTLLGTRPPACVYIRAGSHYGSLSHYAHNIHHQSEFVFPAVERLLQLMSGRGKAATLPPVVVVADLDLLPWSHAMLLLVAPHATIVDSAQMKGQKQNKQNASLHQQQRISAALAHCGGLSGAASDRVPDPYHQAYFRDPRTFDLLRSAASLACGLAIPRHCVGSAEERAVKIAVLDRNRKRPFVEAGALVAALQQCFPAARVELRNITDDPTMCQQVGWFSGVDVLVVGHGAALTNALFLPARAAMVEVMPTSFGVNRYTIYNATIIGSGVKYQQVVSLPHSYEVWRGGDFSPEACLREHGHCYTWHRDRPLRPLTEDVVAAIRSMGRLRVVCQQMDT